MLWRRPPIADHALSLTTNLLILAGALCVEAAVGYPDPVFRAIGHPVMWIGAMLAWLDRRCNCGPAMRRRLRGVLVACALVAVAAVPALLLQTAARRLPDGLGLLVAMLLASTLLAQRSLYRHVRAVSRGLEQGLAGGRAAVSHIVGRNPERLDEAGVIRAAIESLAENFSDGVVAPALWCGLLGLPGIAAYKAINTADSMIGHRTPRHEAFGWAAARLDDLVNLPASRLAALWLVLAACLHPRTSARAAMRAIWRDAGRHRSPNAGWPEAAMAGALGLRLAGPRVYGDAPVDDAWMGDGRPAATLADLALALSVYRLACGIEIAVAVALALIVRC